MHGPTIHIQNLFKCLVIKCCSHYESCYVLETDSVLFHIVPLSNFSSCGDSLKIVWNVKCFVTWGFTEDRVDFEVFRHVGIH